MYEQYSYVSIKLKHILFLSLDNLLDAAKTISAKNALSSLFVLNVSIKTDTSSVPWSAFPLPALAGQSVNRTRRFEGWC